MDHKVDLIVKLGGSAITDKSKLETLKTDEIQKAAELIKKCVDGGVKCIVVHGAGSFGHHHAHEYGVNTGLSGDDSGGADDRTRLGFALTRLSVTKLNHHVTSCLVTAGLPAVSMPACGRWWTQGSQQVLEHDVGSIMNVLRMGFVPVLHGDCVLDCKQGCSILSGDTIIKVLCERAWPPRVVFLTDVDGVYTQPPHEEGAELIEHITVNSLGEMDSSLRTSQLHQDTTGGISGKLRAAAAILTATRGRTAVFICGLLSPAAQAACCNGWLGEHRATTLSYDS